MARRRPPHVHAGAAALAAALALFLAAPAAAHDFWVEPAEGRAAVGTPLALRALIGHGEEQTEYRRNPRHIRSFRVHTPTGPRMVAGAPGGPAGTFVPKRAGLHVFAYASTPSFTQLTRKAFLAYLREEGLTRFLEEVRGRRGDASVVVRESFARCAKALVAVEGSAKGAHDRIVGLDLELVCEADPFHQERGAPLRVRLLLRGTPLAGARISAYRRDAPEKAVHVVTDKAGRARVPLDGPGRWLVKSVHIERAPRRDAADWASLWATLTFETRASKPTPASAKKADAAPDDGPR